MIFVNYLIYLNQFNFLFFL